MYLPITACTMEGTVQPLLSRMHIHAPTHTHNLGNVTSNTHLRTKSESIIRATQKRRRSVDKLQYSLLCVTNHLFTLQSFYCEQYGRIGLYAHHIGLDVVTCANLTTNLRIPFLYVPLQSLC